VSTSRQVVTAPSDHSPEPSQAGVARIETLDGTLIALPGESVLETLERHGQHLEFQCRNGYCGACRTPLLAGQVHYQTVPLAFITQGECLPCCCKPIGTIRLKLNITPGSTTPSGQLR